MHHAKTHLSQLLKEVERGQTVVICRGEAPVAQLVRVEPSAVPGRPAVGEPTTTAVSWTEDTFAPLTDRELEAWGL